ncbi:MAG: hypothetical protein IKH57_08800 [Clostridia bacterium]|nr:hypothetical protein [Clostridia bacterium]
MIDFHAHILPGIDDGSRDLAMTEAMLREEKRQGVELIAATPHFYADRMSIDSFLHRRKESLEKMKRLIQEADMQLPQVIAGAEVYYFAGIGQAQEIARLCAEGTKTILVEMPFAQWTEEMIGDIEALIARQNLSVVLAHVERYMAFQKDKSVWSRMLALPLIPQINTGSFLKPGGLFRSDKPRRFCLNFLKEHPYTIVGTDCHNMEGRRPNLAAARREIETALGAEALDGIDAAVKDALGLAG